MTQKPKSHDPTAAVSAEVDSARLRVLFDEAMELPASEREAWLLEQPIEDDLRIALLRLIRAADRNGPLETPPLLRAARIGDEADQTGPQSLIGERVGAFRLTRLLGQGGMATVFLAERESADFHHQVAVKLLRRGLYSEIEQRLFRRERQALASLSHPNIAHLIDGGITEAGIPYLAIEHVDGTAITNHVAERQLDLRARLRLFVIVCRAVEAAHRQLIVHRDIKPSNILVTGDGTVKLLDFGIAKLLDEGDEQATRTGMAALTPGYAAPEQYAGTAITTATDVYALGVLLHELLLGERPLSTDPVQRPSSRAAELKTDLWVLPASRTVLRTALRGDLDNILLKSLANEPERRYSSAAELADDIERHLDARPVKAHPPSRWYRTRKFVQRHRGGVALTTTLVLAVLASLGIAVWQASVAREQARRATEQSTLAQNESRRANEVRNFIEGLFEPINQGFPEHRTPDVKDLVASGIERLHANQELGPAERTDMLMMFARLRDRLGEPAAARELATEADALATDQLEPLHAKAIEALVLRGDLAIRIGDLGTAEPPLREALRRLRLQPLDSPLLHEVLESLANIENHRGNPEAALQLAQESLVERIRIYGADSVGAAAGHNNVGVGLFGLGRFDEAADAYRRTYEIDARHQETDSYYVLFSLSNWGHALVEAGRLREARTRLAEVEQAMTRLGGKPRPGQIVNRQRLCLLDAVFGSPDSAAHSCTDLVSMTDAYTGGEGVYSAMSLRVEAIRKREAGDFGASLDLLEKARALLSDIPEHARFRGTLLQTLATLWWLRGDADRALDDAAAALSLLEIFPNHRAAATELRALATLICATDTEKACDTSLADGMDATLAEPENIANPNYLLAYTFRLRSRMMEDPTAIAPDLRRLESAIVAAESQLMGTHPLIASARIWRTRALAVLDHCDVSPGQWQSAATDIADTNSLNPWLRETLLSKARSRCSTR